MLPTTFPRTLCALVLLLVASVAADSGQFKRQPVEQGQSYNLLNPHGQLDARALCKPGQKFCLPDGCIPDSGVCCDDGTYCPDGLKCVGLTDCCPATGCTTAASSEPGSPSSTPVSGRSSASLQASSVTGPPTSSPYDYGSAISEYISIFTELSQLIVTSTASNGSTAVTTEQVPYTTTVTVYANSTGNASAQFSATASILAVGPTLTTSSGGATASSSSSGAAKVGGCWSGAVVGVTVMAIVIVSAIFTLQ
jgi:hypothetical protein